MRRSACVEMLPSSFGIALGSRSWRVTRTWSCIANLVARASVAGVRAAGFAFGFGVLACDDEGVGEDAGLINIHKFQVVVQGLSTQYGTRYSLAKQYGTVKF